MNKIRNIEDTFNWVYGDSALDAFLDINNYSYKTVKTGIKQLDMVLNGGLSVGLTCIGALPSLGKTTLCLQIADNIASNNKHVMFVTIEQTAEELLTKSLARINYFRAGGLTVHDIETKSRALYDRSEWTSLVDAVDEYNDKISLYMHLFEAKNQPSVDDIENAARFIAEQTGEIPVIFIDYLQLLKPSSTTAMDKQNIDRNISALRQLARDLETPIVLISSLNRISYNNAVGLESFKESGSIEYSSDVLISLQPTGFNELIFDSKYKQKDNAKKMLKKIMQSEERELELNVIKNRNGRIQDGIELLFLPSHGLFLEQTSIQF